MIGLLRNHVATCSFSLVPRPRQRAAAQATNATIPSSSQVQNELSLATPHFSLFVLGLPFPNRKAEVKFHYSFWNFRSQIEKRKLICRNLFWNKSKKQGTIRFGTRLPNRREDAKAEIGFTIRYGTWS